MRYLCVPALLLLGACQSAIPFEPVTDQCGSLNYLSKVGLKEESVSPSTFPAGTRIIHPDTQVTRDYRADRLNVHLNAQGRIERIDCG